MFNTADFTNELVKFFLITSSWTSLRSINQQLTSWKVHAWLLDMYKRIQQVCIYARTMLSSAHFRSCTILIILFINESSVIFFYLILHPNLDFFPQTPVCLMNDVRVHICVLMLGDVKLALCKLLGRGGQGSGSPPTMF